MATKKPATKRTSAKSSPKKTSTVTTKTATAKTATKSVKKQKRTPILFARKHEKEDIVSIFENSKIVAAILAEIFGTAMLTMIILFAMILTRGILPWYVWICILPIPMVFLAFSGSHFNPAISVAMMASRRISVIRGVIYIIAQFIGAWIAFLAVNAFRLSKADTMIDMPSIKLATGSLVGVAIAIELIGTMIAGFFYTRALAFKRSSLTFAMIVTAGLMTAYFIALAVTQITASAAPTGASNALIYALNPAIALTLQAFPVSGINFAQFCQALGTYILVPMLGAVIGVFLADIMKRCANIPLAEEAAQEK